MRFPKSHLFQLLLLASLTQLPAQTDSTFYHSLIDSLIQQVDTANVSRHINNLCWANGYQSRVTFTPGNIWAANYIKQSLQSYSGLTAVEFDTFFISGAPNPYNSFPLVNVVATLKGNNPALPHYILGGHYDASASLDPGINWPTAWPGVLAQGADDNASGVAVILEVARILSDPQNKFDNEITIKFVAFAAEESHPAIYNLHHQGSSHYANSAYNQGTQIAGAFIVDMVGFTGTAYYHFNIVSNQNSTVLGKAMLRVNQMYQLGLHSNSAPFPYASYSDHDRFWRRGYRAILLVENAPPWKNNLPWYVKNHYYHTRLDTPEKVNISLISKIAQISVGTLACLSSPGLTRMTTNRNSLSPEKISLLPNYPNLFNTATAIPYRLISNGEIEVNIYDIHGQKISELFKGWQAAGEHQLCWQTTDKQRDDLPGGMYILQLKTSQQVAYGKILFIKY